MSKSFEEILRSLDHEIPQNNGKSKKNSQRVQPPGRDCNDDMLPKVEDMSTLSWYMSRFDIVGLL
jgi:hypothetical protein